MARPPNIRSIGQWGGEWPRTATTIVPYGLYAPAQYHPYQMNPALMAAAVPTTTTTPQVVTNGQEMVPVQQAIKRPHSEVEKATIGVNSKEHHVLWMRAYDKPMPEFVKNKCKPLFCEFCSVNLNSVIQAKMHYEGKLHEKKVRFALQTWAKENNTVPPKRAQRAKNQADNSLAPPNKSARFDPAYDRSHDLFCGPCDTSFTSHAHAQQHFSGRNHKRVMSGLAPLKAGYFNTRTGKWQRQPLQNEESVEEPVDNYAFANLHPLPPPPLPPPPPPPPGQDSPSPTKKFFCQVCGINATSEGQLEMHLKGRNHSAKLVKVKHGNINEDLGNNKPNSQEPTNLLSSSIMDDMVHFGFHQPKLEPEVKSKPKKDYSIYRTPSGQYYCALCNLCVNSENQFVQHVASRKHKLKESSAKGRKTKPKK